MQTRELIFSKGIINVPLNESKSEGTYISYNIIGKRNPIDKALNTCLDINPESRACPRATQHGSAMCGGRSPCQQS